MIHEIERPFKSETGRDGRFSSVPKPMREADRWAVAGPDKKPRNASTGALASSNDPHTWASFDVALLAVSDPSTPYDRLYFASGDGFGFADLDGCVRGGVIHPDVQTLIDAMGGYAELSPSGEGVRIPTHDPDYTSGDGYRKLKHKAVPWTDYVSDRRGKPGEVEAYEGEQFGSITSNVVSDAPLARSLDAVFGRYPKPTNTLRLVKPDPKRSPEMDNEQILRLLGSFKNGRRFKALYEDGEYPDGGDSEADYALAYRLAFVTQDPDQIERLMRDSALCRDKWDTHRTYLRDITINNAIERRLASGEVWTGPGKSGEVRGTTQPDYRDVAIERLGGHVAGTAAGFRVYRDGVWREANTRVVGAAVDAVVEEREPNRVSTSLSNSIVGLIDRKTFVRDWNTANVLVLANGTLDLDTLEFRNHSPDDHATHGVGYEYDPAARSEAWERFLNEAVGPDIARLLQRFVGYALTRDTSHEIALWLNGPRGSGKSTFIETVAKTLGEMAGTLGLARIEASQFALADVPGRTLLTATEQPAGHTRATHVLNALISGELLDIEQKHKPVYTVRPVAKLLWAMNDAPRVSDPTSGIFRRIRLVNWPARTVAEDTTLKERLEADLPAVLNWALRGLRDLRAVTGTTDEIFAVPAAVTASTVAYEHDQDNVRTWRDSECTAVNGSAAFSALYKSYREWCWQNGFTAMNSKNFGAALDRLGHAAKKMNGTRVRLGIVVGTGGRPFDDPPSGPSGGTGAHRVASGTPDPESDPGKSRIDMPRSAQQGRTGSHDSKSSLDPEPVNGTGKACAMETSAPVRPCADKTPANSNNSTGSDAPSDSDPVPHRSDTRGNAAPLPDREGFHDAALGILREVEAADELTWRHECEDRGYPFDPYEFREIVEDLVADGVVREFPEDPRFALERASEDGWDDYPEFYAGAATYGAVDV